MSQGKGFRCCTARSQFYPLPSIPAMARSASCPARTESVRSQQTNTQAIAANFDLSNSNGCGGDSPTGLRAFSRIWARLLATLITWAPLVRVEAWHNRFYAMVMWAPVGPTSILRPAMWHTTLVRALPGSAGIAINLAWIQTALNHALAAMTAPHRAATGVISTHLSMPPWRSSWNYGLPVIFEPTCTALMHMAESMLLASDPSIMILERRRLHISWNN